MSSGAKLIGIILLIILLVGLYPMLIQFLWAHSVNPIFGLREISWTEAFCLSALCGCLFKANVSFKKDKS